MKSYHMIHTILMHLPQPEAPYWQLLGMFYRRLGLLIAQPPRPLLALRASSPKVENVPAFVFHSV